MWGGIIGRIAGVAVLIVCGAGVGGVAPVSACACGGVASSDGSVSVSDEMALVDWDGQRETILMRLALRSGTDDAALIVPTPAPANVTAGSAATFTELRRLTAPEVTTQRRWFGRGGNGDTAAAGAPRAGPTVLDRVQLGPLEATTLAGGELDGIREWLSDNGYQLRPEVIDTMEPYLREGWSFVAMRLTSSEPLNGALDPVRLAFDTERFVYPMRMSAAAKDPQTVRLYLLSDHRVQRSDADTTSQSVTIEFAGRVEKATDPELSELIGSGRNYLTELSSYIGQPSAITTDFTFAAAASDKSYREQISRTDYVEFLGVPAGFVIFGVALLAAVVVIVAVIRTLLRRPTED